MIISDIPCLRTGNATFPAFASAVAAYASAVRESLCRSHAAAAQATLAAVQREAKYLQGALGEYLATPLRSDRATISKVHEEAMSRLVREITGEGEIPPEVDAYRLRTPGTTDRRVREVIGRGISWLAGTGEQSPGEGHLIVISIGTASLSPLTVDPHPAAKEFSILRQVASRGERQGHAVPSGAGHVLSLIIVPGGTRHDQFVTSAHAALTALGGNPPAVCSVWEEGIVSGAGSATLLRLSHSPDLTLPVITGVLGACGEPPSGADRIGIVPLLSAGSM